MLSALADAIFLALFDSIPGSSPKPSKDPLERANERQVDREATAFAVGGFTMVVILCVSIFGIFTVGSAITSKPLLIAAIIGIAAFMFIACAVTGMVMARYLRAGKQKMNAEQSEILRSREQQQQQQMSRGTEKPVPTPSS